MWKPKVDPVFKLNATLKSSLNLCDIYISKSKDLFLLAEELCAVINGWIVWLKEYYLEWVVRSQDYFINGHNFDFLLKPFLILDIVEKNQNRFLIRKSLPFPCIILNGAQIFKFIGFIYDTLNFKLIFSGYKYKI